MRPVSPDTLEELGRLLNEFPGGECFAWFDKGMSELVVTTSMYGLDPDQYEGEDVEWIEEPQDDRTCSGVRRLGHNMLDKHHVRATCCHDSPLP